MSGGSNYQELLSSSDDSVVMGGLQQLCEQLNMSSVMPFFRMNVAGIIPCIVKCLQRQGHPDMNLLAARVLTYMVDSFPPTVTTLSEPEHVDALLNPLRVIEDVELSEQCLTCVEKVCESTVGAMSVLQADGISAMLTFADFFTMSSQRKIWVNASRICSCVSSGSFPLVRSVLPTLRAGTSNEDTTIRCKAITSITHIIRGVREKRDLVDETFGDMCNSLLRILFNQEKEETTFLAALSLIQIAVSCSDKVAKKVVDSELITALLTLLHDSTSSESPAHSPVLDGEGPGSGDMEVEHSALTRNRRFKISLEETRVLSSIFTELLPAVREGNMIHLESLRAREFKFPEDVETDNGDDDDDDNDDDEEGEEDDDDDEDELAVERDGNDNEEEQESERHEEEGERLRTRIRLASIPLTTVREHSRIRSKNCICDGCGRRIKAANWFHCNRCPNFDFCGQCLLAQHASHYHGEHNFTDMNELRKGKYNAAHDAAQREVDVGKKSVYTANPKLLVVVLRALPGAVRLSAESEAPLIRYFCMVFLARAVHIANTQQLMDCGIARTHISETISIALNNPYLLTYLGIFLAQKLIEKVPKVYKEVLIREGIAHNLQKLKTSLSSPASKRQRTEPEMLSNSWWKDVIAGEATALMTSLTAGKGKEKSKSLQKLCKLLKENKLMDAFSQLRDVLLTDITTFELISGNAAHELKEALVKSNSIEDIVKLVHILSTTERAAANAPSPLLKLVRHFHGILTYLDSFESPKFGSVENMQSKINIRLVPDNIMKGSSSASPSPSANELEDGMGLSSRQSANVAVEPLADISTIGFFVAQKLLHIRSPLRSASDEEEDTTEDTPSVWLRYEMKVLPLSMTMVQLIQMLGELNKSKSSKEEKSKHADRPSSKNPILYYSDVPYTGAEFEFLSVAPKIPETNSDKVRVIVPSQDAYPSAAGSVLRNLKMSFPWSKRFLDNAQKDVLTVMAVLHEVVKRWADIAPTMDPRVTRDLKCQVLTAPAISLTDFCHQKLNNKAMRHSSNFLLAGQHLRTWAVNLALDCGFLFFPTTRKFLFDISFCGTIRSMVRMQQKIGDYGVLDRSSADHNSARSFRLRRVKKRVWRDLPLEFAVKFFGGQRSSGSVAWDFEFFGEVGLGSGPTKEFYTLVAQALQERKLNLWKASDEPEESKNFTPVNGLYPRLSPFGVQEDASAVQETEKYFTLVGRFIARALLDDHVPTLFLSPALLRLLRGDCCTVDDVADIDPSVHKLLQAIIVAHRTGTHMIRLSGQKKEFPIESMSLDFTLSNISLLGDGTGESVDVTAENMMQYCDAVVETVLKNGVEKAVLAMRRGFDDYIPLYSLQMLTVEELQEVIKGHDRLVTRQEFVDNCLADHGYTLSSRPVQWLFDILSSFTVEEQKTFFLFLTGSVNLPIGGLASLHPKLTIVRKTSSEESVKESDQLPSAMTCQNYLKLPSYESMEQMEAKIRQAMEEGKGSFHLT